MDDNSLNPAEDEHFDEAPETPEDVAVLYTWANVHGGKYRDFSASRREYRAQQRHRMVEAQRQAELEAARLKEEAAARELEEARRREEEAAHDSVEKQQAEAARRLAEERAEQDRLAAQRHVEVAESLKRAMEEAQKEMEEARCRAEEQAARYAEADARYRASAAPQQIPGEIDDPYYYSGPLEPGAFAPGKGVRSSVPQRVSSERRIASDYYRSRGSSEVVAAVTPSGERDPHGLFSSGLRRRPSGARALYTESQEIPAAGHASHFPAVPIDTPEDTLERHRPDELDRIASRRNEKTDDVTDDDGYYDHRVSRHSSSPSIVPSMSAPNSAASDIHIPPRAQQVRPPSDSGERRIVRSEDPSPGNAHVLDSRIRRRDSAADVSARTTRRSRQMGTVPVSVDARGATPTPGAAISGPAESVRESSYDAMRRLPPQADGRWSDVAAPVSRPGRDTAAPEERPEWLVHDSHSHAVAASPEAPVARHESSPRGEVYRSEARVDAPTSAERRRVDRSSGNGITREARVAASGGAQVPASGPISGEREPREHRFTSAPEEEPKPAPPASDTLQQSRERVAARWFALKGLMGSPAETPADVVMPSRNRDVPVPILCVMALSGGVGKTSMVATIGRTLSSMGERVLLADATPHGLLPYYFGARELRPDVVRTFSPPPGSKDAPVLMVNYEADRLSNDDEGQVALVEEIARHARGAQRVLMDLNSASAWLGRRLASLNAKIMVPVAPDMNSVLGIKSMERFFAGAQDSEGRAVRPFYVLNQFDASLPLHLDVREVLRQQLGDRLLPVMIRRSPAVSEALAEGMTVMDYAPESPVAEDYTHLAEWVRNLAAPVQVQTVKRTIRWSEQ